MYYCIRCTVPLSMILLWQWLIILGPDPQYSEYDRFCKKNCNSNTMFWKVNNSNLVPTISAVMVLMECHYASGKWKMYVKQQGWGDAEDINTNENVILFTPIRKVQPSLCRFSQNSWKLHSVMSKYFIPNFISHTNIKSRISISKLWLSLHIFSWNSPSWNKFLWTTSALYLIQIIHKIQKTWQIFIRYPKKPVTALIFTKFKVKN
jgi:hypothetical protein